MENTFHPNQSDCTVFPFHLALIRSNLTLVLIGMSLIVFQKSKLLFPYFERKVISVNFLG